eukprot:CAMPEP_0116936932 /NCGR_PEP_ID=MMETSP0467-20121206/31187_1 /TAXON_ID=283647 /ORGANISM="Mesodinium pulex, Strain SPMC105" /LENGTH=106 /DNA_ID=CAMNT_0004618619 /DNA_START=305 /DNA_END=625 /DNA_ORIENTATION=-
MPDLTPKQPVINAKEFECILELAPKYNQCYNKFAYCSDCIESGCLWDGDIGRCLPPDERHRTIPPSPYCWKNRIVATTKEECQNSQMPFTVDEAKSKGLMDNINNN